MLDVTQKSMANLVSNAMTVYVIWFKGYDSAKVQPPETRQIRILKTRKRMTVLRNDVEWNTLDGNISSIEEQNIRHTT